MPIGSTLMKCTNPMPRFNARPRKPKHIESVRCGCGRLISANKPQCLDCAKKAKS
jgi:hypothetical protein